MTDDPITSPDAQQAPVSPAGTRPAPITDEQLREMMRDEEPSFLERNSGRVVTLALIAVNVVCFVAEMLISGTGQDISILALVQMGAMYAPMVQGPADLYRFVAPMFLHMDLMHLLFNMVALYSVGELLERVLGRGHFLLLYFVAYAVDMAQGGGLSVSAGASTSVFGLFVAVALLCVLVRGNRGVFRDFSKSMLSIIAVNVIYTLLVPNISISGHLGGAIGGAIAMLLLPAASLRTPRPVRIVVAVLWVVAVAAVLVWGGVF